MNETLKNVPTYLAERCEMPFCKGCGHTHVLRKLNEALKETHYSPIDISLVTVKSNCLIFAVRMFHRHKGGYIVIRPSLSDGVIPHFLYLRKEDGDKLIHFSPKKRKRGLMKYLHMLCFHGEISEGDYEYMRRK